MYTLLEEELSKKADR